MTEIQPTNLDSATLKWQNDEFYTTALVLGIDIGLEGIGVHLRKGPKPLYEKTLLFPVPKTNALVDRRLLRAARRCRKNRRTRLKRLRSLFQKHRIPWFDDNDPSLLRSDPFLLRYRALTKKLASREALSICIRHLVTHRGYEYFSDEGEYPWGEEASLNAAIKWVRTAYVDSDTAEYLRTECRVLAELVGGKAEEKYEEFCQLLEDRIYSDENNPILEVLRAYSSEKRNHLRQKARGYAFPRKLIWQHLEAICRRHSDLFDDVEAFLTELGTPGSDKANAIFRYNRKTRAEMEEHWKKKVGFCPYAVDLGLSPNTRRSVRGELPIRRFSLLEFLASRRLQTDEGILVYTSEEGIALLLGWLERFEKAYLDRAPLPASKEIRSIIAADVKSRSGRKLTPDSKSEINSHFFSQLKDILTPTISKRKARASLSAGSAERLFETATANGLDRETVIDNLKLYYDWRKRATNDFGLYPQVEFLLGRRKRSGKSRGEYAVTGKLQKILSLPEVAQHLEEGQQTPDFCVIEVVGDIPRNEKQKREKEQEIKRNRARKEKLFQQFNVSESDTRSAHRRVLLFDQQRGICPYSGRELVDPLSADLQIDHIFPQKRGGISINENLVLTFASLNGEKGNQTPREAAARLSTWDWEAMQAATTKMKWGKKKRELFDWEGPTFPNFGNVTRTAQLARQLVDECARWMEISGEPNEIQRRIGTPSGYLRAQAMRSWQEKIPEKDRSDLVHHLVDAAVVSHIPPGKGMNQVVYGGIFYPEYDPDTDRSRLAALPLGPDLIRWMTNQQESCPIEKHRSQSKYRALHDKTLLQIHDDGTLWARKPLPEKEKITDAESLKSKLVTMGMPLEKIPSGMQLSNWLDSISEEPLKLCDGTPVLSTQEKNPKGNFRPPFGVTAKKGKDGEFREAKMIIEKFDALELWIGTPTAGKNAGKPVYQKRLIPLPSTLKALTKLGYSWKKRKAPPEFQKKPDKPDTHLSLRDLICGPLLPYSKRSHVFRKGQTYRIGLSKDGSIAPRGEQPYWWCWYHISAIKANTQLKFEALQFRDKEKTPLRNLETNFLTLSPMNVDILAQIAGLPEAYDSTSDTSE